MRPPSASTGIDRSSVSPPTASSTRLTGVGDTLELLFPIVHEFVDAEFPEVCLVLAGCSADDVCPGVGRKLDGHVADAAGSGVDEHTLTVAERSRVEEGTPRGETDHRKSGGLRVAERCRLGDDLVRRDGRIFGIGFPGSGIPTRP